MSETYVSVGDVQQVFDPTTFVDAELVADGLLDDHKVRPVRGQDLVDLLCRPHPVHLVVLHTDSETSSQFYCLKQSECKLEPHGATARGSKKIMDFFRMNWKHLLPFPWQHKSRVTHVFGPLEQADVGVERQAGDGRPGAQLDGPQDVRAAGVHGCSRSLHPAGGGGGARVRQVTSEQQLLTREEEELPYATQLISSMVSGS